ncbi:MAG TPA: ArsA family ATPase [Methanomassiliicoccales archaeon]|nr:ArsA family ATPase [Methanomassiliicoccales archaeon]
MRPVAGVPIRVIIYTGKGGVGKTSVAAATALRCAAMGYKTIAISTDQAHSLADSLEVPLSGKVKNIAPNLDALEVDVLYEMEHRWKEVNRYAEEFLESQGIEGVTAKEMTVFPGMELLSALFYIWDYDQSGTYDVIILDTAPTGETLRLLSFPDVSDWYFDKVYRVLKNMVRVARVTVGRVMNAPLPSDELFKDIDHIRDRLRRVKDILVDPEMTSVRLVVNPERMVINETKRAFTYLSLYNLTVEALIINRLLPEEATGDFFKAKLEEQNYYLKVIEESFSPLTMLRATQFSTELVGWQSLEKLADMLFDKSDPSVVYTKEKALEIYTEDGVDILSIRLPFSERGEVELYKTQDTLIVQVGWYKRSITLPYTLTNKETTKAEFKEGRLLIKFQGGEDDGHEQEKRGRRKRGRGSAK